MIETVSTEEYGGMHEAAAVLAWYSPPTLNPVSEPSRSTAEDVDELLQDSDLTVDVKMERRWTLSTEVRIRVLRRLRQQGRIREALAANPRRPDEPMQRVLERYLTGDPPTIAELSMAELVCVRTVCDWLRPAGFGGLPGPEELSAQLRRLLLLQPLEDLAAGGRSNDDRYVNALRDLVRPGVEHAMIVLDSAGSSAAAAGFLLDRARNGLPFAYLDLNRPDVRPPALLPVLLEVARQLLVQFPRAAAYGGPTLLEWQRQLTLPAELDEDNLHSWIGDFTELLDAMGIGSSPILLMVDERRPEPALLRTITRLQDSTPQIRICLCRQPVRPASRPSNRPHRAVERRNAPSWKSASVAERNQRVNTAALGVLVSLAAAGSAFVILGYVFSDVPTAVRVAISAFWALVIFYVDRTILAVSAAAAGKGRTVIVHLPRIAIALTMAVVVGEPLTLSVFAREVEQQLAADAEARRPTFERQVEQAQAADRAAAALPEELALAEIRNLRRYEASLRDEADREMAARAGSTPQCGPTCQGLRLEADSVDARARAKELELAYMREQRTDAIAGLDRAMAVEVDRRVADYVDDAGLFARHAALAQFEQQEPAVAIIRWTLSLFLLLLDLSMMVLKITSSAYDQRLRASLRRTLATAEETGPQGGAEDALSDTGTASTGQHLIGGRWLLNRPIGSGGHGVVWHASDTRRGDEVAVKISRQAQNVGWWNEIRGTPGGQYVAEIIDAGRTGRTHFYVVYPYYQPGSLWTFCVEGAGRRRDLGWCLQIVEQVVFAVAGAHVAGLVHGDIKADNILLEGGDGGRMDVRVADWGNAYEVHTRSEHRRAHWRWCAPEQLGGASRPGGGELADLYAIGALAYWLISGLVPIERELLANDLPRGYDGRIDAYHIGLRPIRLDVLNPAVPVEVADLIELWTQTDPVRRADEGPADTAVLRALRRIGTLRVNRPAYAEIEFIHALEMRRSAPSPPMPSRAVQSRRALDFAFGQEPPAGTGVRGDPTPQLPSRR